MPKGVKKIRYTGKSSYPAMGGGNVLVIKADVQQTFEVSEWKHGTKKEDHDRVVWLLQNSKRNQIIKTYPTASSSVKVVIPKKLCGSMAVFYLEAAFSGKPDKITATGMLIRGYCPPVVVSSEWRTRLQGSNIKNGTPISYGQKVFLHLETEGLNGASVLVEVYNRELGSDKNMAIYSQVMVIDGEINLEIKDTFSWYGKVRNLQKTEEFYVKIKEGDNYVLDAKLQALHAVYLKIDNQIVSRTVELPANNSPVKVGEISVSAQEFDHCRYTGITIKEGKRDLPVFEEKSAENSAITPFEIIAGRLDGNKTFSVTLEGIDISKCTVKPQHTPKTVFGYNSTVKKWVTKESEKTLELRIAYEYGVMDYTGIAMLRYLWQKWPGGIQKHLITANTCRYQKTIPIHVYPDVEWELNFNYAAKNPIYYGDSWKKMTQHRVDDAVNKSLIAALDGTDGKFNTEFSLVLAAKWDGKTEETELGYKYADTIRDFLRVFLKAKSIIDAVSHRDLANNMVVNKLLANPFTMQIDYPKICIGAGWKLDTNPVAKEKVVMMAEGKLGFYPLLAGAGKLDLIALAGKLPVVGQVITALEWTAELLSAKPVFELAAIGEVNAGIKLTRNLSKSRTDFEISVSGKFGLRLEISIKGGGKVDAIIFTADVSYEASGVAESYFEPKVSGGTDDLGAYVNANVDFTGVTIIIIIKGSAGVYKRAFKKKFEMVKRMDNIIQGQHYFIKND